jgi:SAM-dependent methyltransferase
MRPAVQRFPCLEHFSRNVGFTPEALREAFELERAFHARILAEPDPEARDRLYAEVYQLVHPIYERGRTSPPPPPEWNPKLPLIRLLRRELREGEADVLDVGCGAGQFLRGLKAGGHRGRLVGIDAEPPRERLEGIEFVRGGVIRFRTSGQFDLVTLDNAFEHVAPADARDHLESVRAALRPGGAAVILTPNRLFGPWDVTRIVDDTYANRLPAQGTHLHETTYGELSRLVRSCGFVDCRTVAPIARVRPALRDVRLPVELLSWLERVPGVVPALQRWSGKDRWLAAIEITLIARRPL